MTAVTDKSIDWRFQRAREIIEMSKNHYALFTAPPMRLNPLVEAVFRGNVRAVSHSLGLLPSNSPLSGLFQDPDSDASQKTLNQTDMSLVKEFQTHDPNIMQSPMKVALARAENEGKRENGDSANAIEIVQILLRNSESTATYCKENGLTHLTHNQMLDFAETVGTDAADAANIDLELRGQDSPSLS